MHWFSVALGFVSYLAIVSLIAPRFARARRPLILAAGTAWTAGGVVVALGGLPATMIVLLRVILPSGVLVAGYWLSGFFFVQPDVRVENWLRALDHTLLTRTGLLDRFREAPRVVRDYFELSYLFVYVAIPAGAGLLAIAGYASELDRFWTRVLLSEFACYSMLPWIQTRPPRALEVSPLPVPLTLVKRLNLALLERASIQANTVPSGHAAGAVATALGIGSTMPRASAVFLVLAVSIAIATVIGRYHYIADTVLGVLVALAAWWLV